MTFASMLLVGFAMSTLVAAVFAVATGSDERARARWSLWVSGSLAAVLALVGAVPIALALVFVAAGQGLVTLHAVSIVETLDGGGEAERERRRAAPSHWLLIVLGIFGGVYLVSAIGSALRGLDSSANVGAAVGFADVARVVLVEHGIATIVVALLLLAVTVASGFLAARESD